MNTKNKHHHIYGLQFIVNDSPIVFYVGHTNDLERRADEHRNNSQNPEHREYHTEKYRWCRSLGEQGIAWTLEPLQLYAVEDEDSEYEWILRQSRQNIQEGISFYDNSPLCNMKGGDFIWEMMADKTINTIKDIKTFRQNKHKIERERRSYLRDFSGTAEPTAQAQKVIDWLHRDAERRQQLADVEAKRQQDRLGKYNTMLNDPERINRIKQETERMMNEQNACKD